MKKLVLLASSFLFLNSCGNIEDSEITSEVFNQTQYEGLKTHKLSDYSYITLVHDDRPNTGPGTSHGKGINFSMTKLDLFASQAIYDIGSISYTEDCKFFTQGQAIPEAYQNYKVTPSLQHSWAVICINYSFDASVGEDVGYPLTIALSNGFQHNFMDYACREFYYNYAQPTYEDQFGPINEGKLKLVSINKNTIACRIK